MEYGNYKTAMDRKQQEKDEEMETSRKNHQRQLEALQATVDNEIKAKGELLKNRKKYESDILDLEGQLEAATRSTGDYTKNIKKLQAQIKVGGMHTYIYGSCPFVLH